MNKEEQTATKETMSYLEQLEAFPRYKRDRINKKLKEQYLRPKETMVANPLRSLGRNQLCPCQSGKKLKTCCLGRLPHLVPAKLGEDYKSQIAKEDLVFITAENRERLQKIVQEGSDGKED